MLSDARRSPSHPARVLALALTLTLSVAGCSDESGLHLRITANAESFSLEHPYDWVEVDSTQGDTQKRFCLFPSDRSPSALEVEADETCADRVTEPFSAELRWASWNFDDERGRSANLRSTSDAPITLEVTAGLGAAVTASASAEAEPSSSWPTVELPLATTQPLFGSETCPLSPSISVDNAFHDFPPCQRACVTAGAVSFGLPAVSSTVECLSGESLTFENGGSCEGCSPFRVLNLASGVSDQCLASGREDVMWRGRFTPTVVDKDYEVILEARFARCREGQGPDCPVTTDCRPPETWITLERNVTDEDGTSTTTSTEIASLSCVPPSANHLWLRLPVPRALLEGASDATASLGQAVVDDADAATACSLDVATIAMILSVNE